MPNMQDPETMAFFGHSGLVLDPRRDRRRIEEENRMMQQIRAQRMQQQEFAQQQAARQQTHEDTMASKGIAQDQLNTYREGITKNREAALEEHKSAELDKLLANPQALETAFGKGSSVPITKAILDARLKSSNVGPISIPPDAAKVALVTEQNKDLAKQGKPLIPVPQPTVIGGGAATTPAANTGAYQPSTAVGPTYSVGSFGGNAPVSEAAQIDYQQRMAQEHAATEQILAANPRAFADPSVGALQGSVVTPDLARTGGVNIKTPSGGFIGGVSKFSPSELAGKIGGTSPTNPPPTEQAASGAQPVNFAPSALAAPHPNAAGVPSATTTHIAGPNVQPQAGPQRELVPADYIGHYLGQAAGAISGAVNPMAGMLGRGMQASMAPNPPPFMAPTKKPTPEEQRMAAQQ